MKILILGGTGFIGPHHANAAVERGHEVTVFNRGTSKSGLPATVERLFGDRNDKLEAIKHRDWDAVLDLATFGPRWVRTLGEAFGDRIQHYTFISTISVYDNPAGNDETDENSNVLAYAGDADPLSVTTPGEHYGALKLLCEREAEQQFPGRALIVRPGYIAGPGDLNGALGYWSLRATKGGEMLVAGDPSTPVQFIDVRDMADWVIRLIEKRATGIYNTVGPADRLDLGQLIGAACRIASSSVNPTWVSSSWLASRKGREMWFQPLFWTSESGGYAGTMRMRIDRALAAGLRTRPVDATLADTLEWHQRQPPDQLEPVTGWRKKQSGDGWEVTRMTWRDYLECEQATLEAWRTHVK